MRLEPTSIPTVVGALANAKMDRIQIQFELRRDGQEVFLQALDEIMEGIMASFPALGNHLVCVLLYHVGRPHLPRYREWNHIRPS